MCLVKNGLQEGAALLLPFFNSPSENSVRRVQANQEGLKLMAHISFWFMLMMLIYRVNTYILVTSKEIGLEGNAEEGNYIFISHKQNAGQYHNIKTGNTYFESVEQFKYVGITLTNPNCMRKLRAG
jgi:hypothetical protein